MAVLIKQLMPQIKVIGVEAEDSACLRAALDAGQPVDLARVGLFAEGVAVKRIGDETFRLCREYLDDVITVDSDAICAAVKDLFEDVRAIAEPSGALALAGLKKYVQQHNIQGERLAHVLSGANLNFHGLRYVSERCELGEQREALLAVTIPEQQGSFLKFCQLLGGRSVTEFNYRYADADNACIFVGVRLTRGHAERREIIDELNADGYQVVDLSDDEMAKLHVRYMVGGRPSKPLRERLYSFEFPESPGALLKFLQTLGTHWNISLFHYRSHGTDFGRVLAAFELAQTEPEFERHLQALGYDCHDETDNPAFRFFCRGEPGAFTRPAGPLIDAGPGDGTPNRGARSRTVRRRGCAARAAFPDAGPAAVAAGRRQCHVADGMPDVGAGGRDGRPRTWLPHGAARLPPPFSWAAARSWRCG